MSEVPVRRFFRSLSIALATAFGFLAVATTASAQLTFAPAANFPAGTYPYSVTSADFNGDGIRD